MACEEVVLKLIRLANDFLSIGTNKIRSYLLEKQICPKIVPLLKDKMFSFGLKTCSEREETRVISPRL